jgi:hypothetical protein
VSVAPSARDGIEELIPMAVAASRTPAPAPSRPARSAARPSSVAGPRPRVPSAAAGPVPAGPAIRLTAAAASKDPRFKRALDSLQQSAAKARHHPPASKKAAEAQAAAVPPANEKLAGAQANKVDDMGAAQTGKPRSSSFLEMLRAEIKKVMPKKTEDAKDFMKGEDRQQLKSAMTGNVAEQKQEATSGLAAASAAPPDTSKVEGKEVAPLPESAPPAPVAIGADQAMPEPKPAAEISLDQGKRDTEKLMTDAEITTPQMRKANDPRFTAVVTTKSKADQFADAGPQQYRAKEQNILASAGKAAAADEKKGLAGFLAQGLKAIQGVRVRQLSAKEKDELERKRVTDHIQGIFDRTKAVVDKKLESLDTEVSTMFDTGADAAVAKMKDYVETRFDDRYSGNGGKALWLKDKLLPLPDSVKAWFDQAHRVFLQEMDSLVVRVANHVERRLKEAKDEIAKGQREIREYVQGLPANLQAVGRTAEKEMRARFDELRQGVDDKKNDLAQKLAQRYKDASEKGAKALQELKDAHKRLYEKVRDAIAEVIKVLREFRNKIMAMLKKAKNAIDLIVADPIGFLKNVLAAIKKGLGQFVDNIWTHLKAGLMAFLLGPLGEAGIEVPKDLSLGSILKLVLQVLGLTYERIRAKAVKLIGERNVALIEQVAGAIKVLLTEGPAKLWEMFKEYLSNLKEMIIDAIQDWLITTIIKAAVTKLVSMFNPVGAIIQAILTIYNVVMFLIERINQILAFVESVINSVYEIATGAIGAAANWIEKALARTVPLIIAFLARLLGISGITEKIVGIIKKIQAKVDQAIDKVIGKVMRGIGKLVGAGKQAVAAAVNWWKARKTFRVADDSHELFFKGEGEAAELTMASTHRVLESYLAEVKRNELSPEQKDRVDAIEAEIRKIQKIKAKTKGSFGQEAGEEIRQALEKIAQLLSTKPYLDVKSPAPPETQATFDTKTITVPGLGSSIVGKKMTADPLSSNRGKLAGSQPFEETPLWNDVNRRPYTYVRGHLLNHHVHGPGMNLNLTPITRSANRKMESQFESYIKGAVLIENQVIKYQVEMHFPSSPISRKLVSEGYLPTKITMQAWKLKKKNQWIISKTLLSPVEVPNELPPDTGAGK